LALPAGANEENDMQFGKVKKLLRNAEGRPILGMANEDPLLNTRQYVVEPHCLKSLFYS
jgi:hypothetical protein